MSIRLEWQTGDDEGRTTIALESEGGSRPSGFRWSWMALLLLLAFGAGMAVGIGWRYVQARRALLSDLDAVIAELRLYIEQGDREGFMALMDPGDGVWRAYQTAWFEALQKSPSPPMLPVELLDVTLEGDRAWAWVLMQTDVDPVMARFDFALRRGRWFIASPDVSAWGEPAQSSAEHVIVRYRALDAQAVEGTVPQLDRFVTNGCRLLDGAGGTCRVVLELSANPLDVGPPASVAYMRLHQAVQPAPSLLQLRLPEGPTILVLSPLPLPLAQEIVRERLQAHYAGDAPLSWPRLEVVRSSRDWPRSAEVFSPEGPDLQVRAPSPSWSGVGERGETPDAWEDMVRHHIAEAMVRTRLGPLVGSASYVDAAWALAVGIAEWLAAPQVVPNTALSWASLESVGRSLQADPSDVLARRRARDAAAYIAATWGPDAFPALLRALGESIDLDTALSRSLTVDASSFEAGWRAYRGR